MNKDIIWIIVWAVLIGGTFIVLWRKGQLTRLTNYVAQTREELRKCTWPTLDELKGSTIVVALSILLLGAFTVGIDFIFNLVISRLI